MYYVYKRYDGHIGVINSSEQLGADEKPERLRSRDAVTGKSLFTVFLTTSDWDEARELVTAKRRLAPGNGFNTLPPPSTPPANPADVRRRTLDEIATRLVAIERELARLDAEI